MGHNIVKRIRGTNYHVNWKITKFMLRVFRCKDVLYGRLRKTNTGRNADSYFSYPNCRGCVNASNCLNVSNLHLNEGGTLN